MSLSPDAILGAATVVTLAGAGALWKLATMLAEVRGQVRHNGGSTLKDDAQKAAQAAGRAEVIADEARTQATALRVVVDRLEARDTAERTDVTRLATVVDKSAAELVEVRSAIAVLTHLAAKAMPPTTT